MADDLQAVALCWVAVVLVASSVVAFGWSVLIFLVVAYLLGVAVTVQRGAGDDRG